MNSKVIFFVVLLAIVSGVYGVIDIWFLTTEKAKTLPETVVKEERYITLWRAKQPLVKGIALTSEMVIREQVPLSEALMLGVKQDVNIDFQPSTLMNKKVNLGEFVFSDYQTSKDQPGYLDLLVMDGMTLYPLTISSKNIISGYIKPGDSIDIMAISSPVKNLSNKTIDIEDFQGVSAVLLLEKIRVISLNQSDSEFVNPQVSTDGNSELTIVIEVKPDELTRLALAQRTMYLEIIRSQVYQQRTYTDASDIIPNYNGVTQLRGSSSSSFEGIIQ